MLHCDKKDHRITRKDFHTLVDNKVDSVSVKMIDFSNIVELREHTLTYPAGEFTGKFARMLTAVSNYEYLPPFLLN